MNTKNEKTPRQDAELNIRRKNSTNHDVMYLPEWDSSPTRRPKITVSPSVKIISLCNGLLLFSVRMNDDSLRSGMNPIADAVEIRYKVGGAAPECVEECVTSDMSKKSIFFIKTGNTNAGKKIWCYLRWVNLSSPEQTGPFGTLMQAVIQ